MTDQLRGLLRRLADELEGMSENSCWRGNFAGCDNGGCAYRRKLLAQARAHLVGDEAVD